MRNFKRTLALVLAVIMVVGTFATVSAAEAHWTQEAVDYIEGIGVDTIGNKIDKEITRNDFVLWIAKIESKQMSTNAWDKKVASVEFTDVNDAHHEAAIAFSYDAGYIIGNGDGTFAPEKTISLAEACAVIVRLMGYEHKVTDPTDPDKWDTNYMRAAGTYCNLFTQEFYAHTDSYDPEYPLSYGEAAYLLAVIMNAPFLKDGNGEDRTLSEGLYNGGVSLTDDGIDLGDYFITNNNLGMTGKSYYVVDMSRTLAQMSPVTTLANGTIDPATGLLVPAAGPVYFKDFDLSDVTLRPVDGGADVTISGEAFLKFVRVSLGLEEERNTEEEEAEIDLFATVSNGAIVNIVLNRADMSGSDITNAIESFEFAADNSVIVDTYLKATVHPYSVNNINRYLGWTANECVSGTSTNYTPALPASYDAETDAYNWTNVKFNKAGDVTSANLTFRGVEYTVVEGAEEATEATDIYVLDGRAIYNGLVNKEDADYEAAAYVELDADAAYRTLLNAAQGECYAVFNDVDGDGDFENVVVYESTPFFYTVDPNVPGGDSNARDIVSSVSGGEVVANVPVKGNGIGTVVLNKTVDLSSSSATGTTNTDAFTLTSTATGKLQLVLCASNKHTINMPQGSYTYTTGGVTYSNVPPYYAVIDLAAFSTGIIEKVDAFSMEGYYIAEVKLTSGEKVTVNIPDSDNVSATTEFDVTIGGATATYTFDSSAWMSYIGEVEANAKIEAGIVGSSDYATIRSATAAWLAGRYVSFVAVDGDVVYMTGTDTEGSAANTEGFVVNTTKTNGGDNTYDVTVAVTTTTSVATDVVYNTTDRYLTEAILDGWTGSTGPINNGIAHTSGKAAFTAYTDANGETYYAMADANGNAMTDANGNLIDRDGNKFSWYRLTTSVEGVGDVKTFSVRAGFSSVTDWKNYEVYTAIFAGILLDPNYATVADEYLVNPTTDLIYVTVVEDAGEYDYLLYSATPADAISPIKWPATSYGNYYTYNLAGTSARWYYPNQTNTSYAEYNWNVVEGTYLIWYDIISENKYQVNGLWKNDVEVAAAVGYGPYYVRNFDEETKAYEYDVRFTEIAIFDGIEFTLDGVKDMEKTFVQELYLAEYGNGKTQVVITDETKDIFTEENGYYVDENNYVYTLHWNAKLGAYDITWKTDKDGNVIFEDLSFSRENVAGKQPIAAYIGYGNHYGICFDEVEDAVETALAANGIAFNADEVTNVTKAYSIVSVKAKTADDAGYFPGAYYIYVDGNKFNTTKDAEIVIMTPSANGFVSTVTTVDQMAKSGTTYFATDWNATVTPGETLDSIKALAIIGCKTGTVLSETPVGETPVVGEETTLVYLNSSAKAQILHDEFNNNWIVMSTETAYALPTGEAVGAIYRTYSTYEGAREDLISLSIEGGKYYEVDENNEIVGSVEVVPSVGQLISTDVNGKLTANFGKGEVDATNYEFEFFYHDIDGKLVKAGNSTNVTVLDYAAFNDLYKSAMNAEYNAYITLYGELTAEMIAAYDALYGANAAVGANGTSGAFGASIKEYTDGLKIAKTEAGLSATRLQYYVDEYEAAVAAVTEAKEANIEKYFNGQFWGFANSPYFTYVKKNAESFQNENAYIWFDYFVVDGVYCVFSDSFSTSAK